MPPSPAPTPRAPRGDRERGIALLIVLLLTLILVPFAGQFVMQVRLETSPGTVLTVHRQTIGRVIEPAEAPVAAAAEGDPEFGERADGDETPGTTKSTD